MKRLTPMLLALAMLAPLAVWPALHAQETLPVYVGSLSRIEGRRVAHDLTVPGQVTVQFRASADDRIAARLIREAGGGWARKSRFGARYRVGVDAGFTTSDLLARFQTMPDVEFAEPVHRMHAFQARGLFVPNDPQFTRLQWNFNMIHADRMWAIQKGDPSVAVAVIDTGIAYETFGRFVKAPDWGSVVFLRGFNALTGTEHANDDNYHGTHVASTVAEATNNNIGVAGLAFNCALLPVKVLDQNGDGDDFDVADGIDYAVGFREGGTNPVKVINLSLGGDFSRVMSNAIDRAISNGITVVAAAGNDDGGPVSFPASHANVIGVGALDGRKQRASYSNFGPELDVMAPGGDFDRDDTGANGAPDGIPDGIFQQTFAPLGRFDLFALVALNGTSMASPHVAGLAALLYRQGITEPKSIKAAIENTAEDLGPPGRDDQTGHGMIRPDLALAGYGLNR